MRDRPRGGAAGNAAPAADEGCSFSATTKVATAQGEQAIGTIRPGEEVEAYNPQTQHMELEPILHVWINHDHDLVDLTLTTSKPAPHGKPAARTSEVIHTNQKHPFLTKEKGFLPVGQIKLGMHVLRADGTYGVVTRWKSVPGASVMYNLEVAQDHTFTVGNGQWVVHNECGPTPSGDFIVGPYKDVRREASGNMQAHHIFQDAMMRSLEPYGYNYYDAPAIALEGGWGYPGTEHEWANMMQVALGEEFLMEWRAGLRTSLTFAEATTVAGHALIAAGVTGPDLSYAMSYATNYFETNFSPEVLNALRIPGT